MKTNVRILLLLIGWLITLGAQAAPDSTVANEPWFTAPSTAFAVQTQELPSGWLMINVVNNAQRELSVRVQAPDGTDLLVRMLDRTMSHLITVDVRNLPSGLYLLDVGSDTERVVKQLQLHAVPGGPDQINVVAVSSTGRL